MSAVIGLRFRRNKYGLSLWEDRIGEIVWHRKYHDLKEESETGYEPIDVMISRIKRRKGMGFTLVPKVLGRNTLKAYDLDEIIVYND